MATGDEWVYTTGSDDSDPLALYDWSLTGYTAGFKDNQQDIVIESENTNGDTIEFEVKRALNSGDTNDFTFDPQASTLQMVWAKSTIPNDFQLAYHGSNRGSNTLTIIQPVETSSTTSTSTSDTITRSISDKISTSNKSNSVSTDPTSSVSRSQTSSSSNISNLDPTGESDDGPLNYSLFWISGILNIVFIHIHSKRKS